MVFFLALFYFLGVAWLIVLCLWLWLWLGAARRGWNDCRVGRSGLGRSRLLRAACRIV